MGGPIWSEMAMRRTWNGSLHTEWGRFSVGYASEKSGVVIKIGIVTEGLKTRTGSLARAYGVRIDNHWTCVPFAATTSHFQWGSSGN
jgi:hypothetical protein